MSSPPARDALANALHARWLTFRKHHPVGAYLPVGDLDGDCRECGGPWPCDTVLDDLFASFDAIHDGSGWEASC